MSKSPDGYRTICKKCRAVAEGKVYIPYEPPGYKYCRHCQQMLPATNEYYQPIPKGKYGLESRCRSCKNAEWVERYHLDIETSREYSRNKYAANPEPDRKRSKRRAVERPEYSQEWYQANKKRVQPLRRANSARRRARELAAPGSHTAADIRLQVAAQTDKQGRIRCWWCSGIVKPDDYHVDHRIALAKGGSNAPDNLVISCPTCNMSKNDKSPQEWAGRLL